MLLVGSRLNSFAEQGQYQPLSMEIQVPIIYAGVNGLVRDGPSYAPIVTHVNSL